MVLITHQYSSDCSVLVHHQGISNPPLKRAVDWRWARDWQRAQPGHLTWTRSRDFPYCMASYSAIKRRGERRREGHSWLWYLFSEAIAICVLRPCFPGTGWTSACWWVMNKFPLFSLLLCVAFAFLVKLPLPQPTSLLFSSPVLLKRGSLRMTGWGSDRQPRSIHHNVLC